MVNGLNTSISGLLDASKKIDVAANNIANAQSTQARLSSGEVVQQRFVPNEASSVSTAPEGVSTQVRSSAEAQAPTSLVTEALASSLGLSNVDLAEEAVDTIQAANQYEANLASIRVQNNTSEALLDIFE